MLDAIEGFVGRLKSADAGIFYYAGDGMEFDSQNYLVPRDARSGKAPWLAADSVPLDEVFRDVAGVAKPALLFVDACRNDPFTGAMAEAGRGAAPLAGAVNAGGGFGKVTNDALFDTMNDVLGDGAAPPTMFVVVMSTDAGRTADDGAGRNSTFAETVVEGLAQPGRSLLDVFDDIVDRVTAATKGRQRPYLAAAGTAAAFSLWPACR